MFCKYCGKELNEGSAFCKYCGQAQKTASFVQPVPKTAKQEYAEPAELQNTVQSVVIDAVKDPAQNVVQKARRPLSKGEFFRCLKATCKLLSLSGWLSLVGVTLSAVLALFVLLDIILMLSLDGLPALLILVLFSAWLYIFGVHQFWHAAVIEEGLNITLPDGKDDAAWLVFIRDKFVFEGAQLSETQPENAVVYLMNGAQIWLTAENNTLHIAVKHHKRFNSARSGGHWELQESFDADNLKCALDYFLKGQSLPDSFVQDQKAAHKDKVGKVKKGLIVTTIVLVLLMILVSLFGQSPISSLKATTWDQYDSSGVTLGEAFEKNFENTSWELSERDGNQFIRFTGTFDVEGYGSNLAEIIFSVKKTGDSYFFSIYYAEINDTVLSDYEQIALMQYAFDGNADDLVSAFFVSWLFG